MHERRFQPGKIDPIDSLVERSPDFQGNVSSMLFVQLAICCIHLFNGLYRLICSEQVVMAVATVRI